MNRKITFLLTAVVIASFFMIQTGGGARPVDREKGIRPALSDDSEKSALQFRDRRSAVKDKVIFEPAPSGKEKLDALTGANHERVGKVSAARISKMKKIFFLILTLSESR